MKRDVPQRSDPGSRGVSVAGSEDETLLQIMIRLERRRGYSFHALAEAHIRISGSLLQISWRSYPYLFLQAS